MLETITISSDDNSSDHSAAGLITKISPAIRDNNRVNIYVDDKFFCSLDISQVVDLRIKMGKKLNEEELNKLKVASDFGKFYARALEYVLLRPRSSKEIRDYLKKKTLSRKISIKNRKTGEYKVVDKPGYSKELVEPVLERLKKRGYINDELFAKQWIQNRAVIKGTSKKKLELELRQKGVDNAIIEQALATSGRDDKNELRKVIAKKSTRYPDEQKFVQYLVRLGFNYSDILDELSLEDSSD